MGTPGILYDLIGGRYWIRDPSRKMSVWICSRSALWFLRIRGFPRARWAALASHFVVSSWSPVYWLKRWSFLT